MDVLTIAEKRPERDSSIEPRPAWWLPRPAHVMALTFVSLGLAWTVVILVDVLNVFGSRDALAAAGLSHPVLWIHLFADHPIEWLQYLFLAGTSVTSGVLGGLLLTRGTRGAGIFWILLCIGAALMLVEDAANIRHTLALYVDRAFSRLLDWEWRYWQTLTIMVYFSALVAVPLYALLRYGRYVWSSTWTRFYLALGFLVYGVVAMANGTKAIRIGGEHPWYAVAGSYVIDGLEVLAKGAMILPPGTDPSRLGWRFMDQVVEESVELIAAAALLCASLAYLAEYARQQRAGLPVASEALSIVKGGPKPTKE